MQQFFVQFSRCRSLSAIVERHSEFIGIIVQNGVHRTNVKCDSLVPMFKRHIRKSSEVHAIVIFAKKQPVTNWNQRCSLSAQCDIGNAKITYDGITNEFR